MKERTKETLRDGFGCLINNAAAMRGAKNGPLWLTIVMFILAIFLPVIPLFVSQANVKGSSFLNSYSYGLERYVTSMALELKDEGYKFGIDEKHLLTVSKDGNEINYSDYGSRQALKGYVDKTTGQYDFLLFVLTLVLGNVALRVAYEGMMLLIGIWNNTKEINAKTKK